MPRLLTIMRREHRLLKLLIHPSPDIPGPPWTRDIKACIFCVMSCYCRNECITMGYFANLEHQIKFSPEPLNLKIWSLFKFLLNAKWHEFSFVIWHLRPHASRIWRHCMSHHDSIQTKNHTKTYKKQKRCQIESSSQQMTGMKSYMTYPKREQFWFTVPLNGSR